MGGAEAAMVYRIAHVTEYRYGEAVATSHHLLHLAPRETERQVNRREELVVSPVPASRADRIDYFGNRSTYFEVQTPHRELTVESRREVELLPLPPPPASGGPPWETVRDEARRPHDAESLHACEMTFPSPFVRWSAEVIDF